MKEEHQSEDDLSSLNKKRTREEKDAEDKKSRGNYRCSKCNVPKKGHICPYQPRFRRRDHVVEGATKEVEIQCELDELMTVRTLQLEIQGFMESYMMPLPDNMGTETAMKLVQEEMSTA